MSRVTALVLAAGRRSGQDPVAIHSGASHKCLVKVDGVPMVERVIRSLIASGVVGRILISVESEAVLRRAPELAHRLDAGTIEVTPSAANLADSVLALADFGNTPLPLLVTTADNVLHTPELIAGFVADSLKGQADVAVGVTREATVRAEFPDEPLGFFRFRDGGYSFCNLFVFTGPKSFQTAEVFRGGGQFRKRPWRILRAFGVMNLLLYRLRLTTLASSFRRISRGFGIAVEPVEVPWPFAPIDVDNPRTLALAERILKQRREA